MLTVRQTDVQAYFSKRSGELVVWRSAGQSEFGLETMEKDVTYGIKRG